MDGEVAQLAALVISANHRLAYPDDPMRWFPSQRAFARCGSISFEIATKRRQEKAALTTMAATPPSWLEQLARSGTKRVYLGFTRQDEEVIPGETIPDRIAAGFAGGGSLWTMTTETDDGRALDWHGAWKVAYPNARDGRIWAVRYTATAAAPRTPGADIASASVELRHALADMSEFAWEREAKAANMRFTSALALLEGAPDPLPVDHPAGPADTLSEPARRLLHAAQRGWVFDNLELWGKLKLDEAEWRDHARRSEALYDAVTGAIVASANSAAPAR